MPSIKSAIALLSATAVMAAPAMKKRADDKYAQRAIESYNLVTGSGTYKNTEYFSAEVVPYHSIETLMVEAPDHGHESVSETFSFWVWLEAVNGKLTGEYKGVETAWEYLEKHMIPDSKNQPGMSKYNSSSPATYAPEDDDITNYPAQLIFENSLVGQDPLAAELQQAYGTWDIYAMHWIIDGDNWYGYGQQGDGTSKPSFINTFQRGASESAWKTVPHPCWEEFKWGGPNGFLDLFTKDNSYSKQWRYTDAPDADSRAIQAAYFAYIWAKEDGVDLSGLAAKAAKLGDYLRYAQYDKYFKKIGECTDYRSCQAGTGKNSAHYLLSWYFSWGGDIQGGWSWRIGSSHTHTGYQNPLAAWILSTEAAFKPKGATAVEDWSKSLDRQLELIRWLQTAEGCIAGGATNSWQGHYAKPPSDITSFYGMYYDWQPVYHDPPSNNWTGMQGWGQERTCSLYYLTGNEKAGTICKKWSQWVKENVQVSGGEIVHATNLEWTGNPDEWDVANFDSDINKGLHGTVAKTGIDLGSIASIIKGLLWTSMKDDDKEGLKLVLEVMDALENYKDDLGYTVDEVREDYTKFNEEVYIPSGWTGKNAQGAEIKNGAKFIDIRPKYKEDPDWEQVEAALNGGAAPHFTYHRFWGQTEIAVANGIISIYDVASMVDGTATTPTTPEKPAKTTAAGKTKTPTPAAGTTTKCPAKYAEMGYKCCSNNCRIYLVDETGEWGVENNEWCGCPKRKIASAGKCATGITNLNYECCSQCGEVYATDDDGDWGVENGEWCGARTDC